MFVDTAGWASIIVSTEPFHALATTLFQAALARGTRIVTTNLVLGELTALMTSPLRISKPRQIATIRTLRSDPTIEVVFIDPTLDAAAWKLWESRPDKDWSFVDCASFVVMGQRNLTEALTTDHHFEQAGFVRLLK